jgi:hypothetical protein
MAQWKEKSKRKKIQNVENLRAKKADVSRLACWNDAHSDSLLFPLTFSTTQPRKKADDHENRPFVRSSSSLAEHRMLPCSDVKPSGEAWS